MSHRILVTTCCLLAAVAAGAAGPPAVAARPAGAPGDSALVGGAVVVARPGGGEVLDLAACVRLALDGNDALRAERLKLRELSGKKLQALSTGLPTIDATAEWNRGRDPTFALDSTFSGGGGTTGNALIDSLFGGFDFLPDPQDIPAQTFWRTSLNLHWILNPVKVLGAVGAAGQSIRRQELLIRDLEHRTVEQTVVAYHDVVLAAEQLDAARARLADQQELLSILRLRFELGLASDLDTLQAAVAVANLVPEVNRARAGLRQAGARLNAVMGLPPDGPVAVVADTSVEWDPVDRERALALAMERPDLRAVDLLGAMLRQNRRVQKSEMRPYLSVDGSYGLVGRTLDTLDDTGHDFWRATVALNVPLFDGLLTRGNVRETEASIRRNEVASAGLRRQARVEVMNLLDELATARQNLRAARLNLERSRRLLEANRLRLKLGKTDYLTVLQSETGRAQARSNLIRARHDVLTLTAALKRAIGVSPLVPLAAVPGLVKGAS